MKFTPGSQMDWLPFFLVRMKYCPAPGFPVSCFQVFCPGASAQVQQVMAGSE
jgi:hypothetical protein